MQNIWINWNVLFVNKNSILTPPPTDYLLIFFSTFLFHNFSTRLNDIDWRFTGHHFFEIENKWYILHLLKNERKKLRYKHLLFIIFTYIQLLCILYLDVNTPLIKVGVYAFAQPKSTFKVWRYGYLIPVRC